MISEKDLQDAVNAAELCVNKSAELNIWEQIYSPYDLHIMDLVRDNLTKQAYQLAYNNLQLLLSADSMKLVMNDLLCELAESGDVTGSMFLIQIGADCTHKQYAPFILACRHGHLAIVQTIIESGLKPTLVPSALIISLVNQQTDIATELIDHGLSVDMNNGEPLRRCCQEGLFLMVKYLIDRGANANISNGRALVMAVTGGHEDIVKLLLETGADPTCNEGVCFIIAKTKKYSQIECDLVLFNTKKSHRKFGRI